MQLTKENERLIDSYMSFFKNFESIFNSYHMQHMTTQILGLDKTKVQVETKAPAGMYGE